MRVLVACEFSGRVRDCFAERGHYAVSCDLLNTAKPGRHYQGNVLDIIEAGWDLMVAFPPCTDLAIGGAAYWKEKQADGRQQAALEFVETLMSAPIPRIALENPVGRINSAIRKPEQIIEPFMFGDPWKKRTCLWLDGLEPLKPTDLVEPKGFWVSGGGTCRANPGARIADWQVKKEHRQIFRSLTFPGIAKAMAEQWG